MSATETETFFTPEEISGSEFRHIPIESVSTTPESDRTVMKTQAPSRDVQVKENVIIDSLIQLSLGLEEDSAAYTNVEFNPANTVQSRRNSEHNRRILYQGRKR